MTHDRAFVLETLCIQQICCRRLSWWMILTWDANERLFEHKSFIEDIKFHTAPFIREIEKFFSLKSFFLLPEEFHIWALWKMRKVFEDKTRKKISKIYQYPKNYIRRCGVVSGEVEAGWLGRRPLLVLEELHPVKRAVRNQSNCKKWTK